MCCLRGPARPSVPARMQRPGPQPSAQPPASWPALPLGSVQHRGTVRMHIKDIVCRLSQKNESCLDNRGPGHLTCKTPDLQAYAAPISGQVCVPCIAEPWHSSSSHKPTAACYPNLGDEIVQQGQERTLCLACCSLSLALRAETSLWRPLQRSLLAASAACASLACASSLAAASACSTANLIILFISHSTSTCCGLITAPASLIGSASDCGSRATH